MPRLSPRRANLAAFVLLFLVTFGVFDVLLSGPHGAPAAGPVTPQAPIPAVIAPPAPILSSPAAETPPAPEPTEPVGKVETLPILMYHVIGDGPNNLYVQEAVFREQMKYLKDHGFHTVTMDQVYASYHGDRLLPEKPVVVSFDDGYISHYTIAFPVLKEQGFVGTFYLPTHMVDTDRYVSWKQVVEMDRGGMEIAAHTRTHADVRTLTGDRLRAETAGAKKDLEDHLGHPVYGFCYPGGFYSPTAIAALKEAGFRHATTTEPGWATIQQDPYRYARIRVYRGMPMGSFSASVEGHK